MNSRLVIAVGVLATVAILGGVGIGYSLYQGATYSENNTSDIVKNSVDIWADNGSGYAPLETPITMPEFHKGRTVTISGYRLVLSGGGNVYLNCNMVDDVRQKGDDASWCLIERMSITINGGTYDFGVGQISVGNETVTVTGLPTDPIQLTTGGTSFESNGETLVYYDFIISIYFANIDVNEDPNWERLSSFEGSSFEFVFVPSQE